jgi:hypothetical protein
MFCATQVCTKYDSIHVATWLHNFSWDLRAIVCISHILNMTSEACVAIILVLECSPEKARKRCFYINDWIPIDTCCAASPLTMQTSYATAVLHKKYQNSSDFVQQIVQIVNQHHTRSTSCTTHNVAQHDWSEWAPSLWYFESDSRLWPQYLLMYVMPASKQLSGRTRWGSLRVKFWAEYVDVRGRK